MKKQKCCEDKNTRGRVVEGCAGCEGRVAGLFSPANDLAPRQRIKCISRCLACSRRLQRQRRGWGCGCSCNTQSFSLETLGKHLYTCSPSLGQTMMMRTMMMMGCVCCCVMASQARADITCSNHLTPCVSTFQRVLMEVNGGTVVS